MPPAEVRMCTRCGDRPEHVSAKGKRRSWCSRCFNQFNYEIRKRNPEQYRLMHRRSYLKRTYGITLVEYEEIFDAQGRRCAICGVGEDSEVRTNGRQHLEARPSYMPVDHCHDTGVIRGILCSNCNRAIGQLGHDPERLRAAASYLERTSP